MYADLLDALSPVSKAGMDPDEAAADRAGTMAKLLGPDDTPKPKWYEQDQEVAQNDVPPRPGTSQNGNPLPPGLQSRQAPQDAPATDPTPAVPAGVTPTGTATKPDLAAGNAATIGLMQSDYARASQDVQNEAAQPDEATVLAPLERQRVNAQARQVELQTPYGPDGKTLPEYKPSFGQRLMRGVEGFAGGGVLGAIDPKVGGAQPYGAPNKEYGIDQAQAAGRVAGADQQLKNAQDNWKATSDRLKQIAQERRALATTGKDTTSSSIAQQDQPNKDKQAQADLLRAQNEGRPKTLDDAIAQFNAETDPAKKAQLGQTVKDMTDAAMKLKPPRQPGEQPSVGLAEFGAYRAARQKETGKPLSSDDVLNFIHKTDPNAPDEVGSIVAQAMDAKEKFANQWTPNDDGTYKSVDPMNLKTLTGPEFQTQIDKIGRSDPNVKLAKKGYTIDATGNLVPTHTGPAAQAKTPFVPKTPRPPGATGTALVDGKRHWVNAQTHKVLGLAE